MCPGCRAILDAGTKVCPYCGWGIEITEVRRHGGIVQRAVRHFGGLPHALILANVVAAVFMALLNVQVVRKYIVDAPHPLQILLNSLLSTGGGLVRVAGATVPEEVLAGDAWRLLTAVFLHYGVMHLGVNMYSLLGIGSVVEDAYGSGKALALYLLAGLAGTVAGVTAFSVKTLLGMDAATYAAAGASGAICGFAGLLAALGWRIGGPQGKKLWWAMVKPVGFILALGIVLSYTSSSWRLDNWGHGGGFLFGLAAGLLCTFGVRARSSPAVVKAWDAAALLLSLLYAAAFLVAAIRIAAELR